MDHKADSKKYEEQQGEGAVSSGQLRKGKRRSSRRANTFAGRQCPKGVEVVKRRTKGARIKPTATRYHGAHKYEYI